MTLIDMQDYNPVARRYWWTVTLLGAAALVYAVGNVVAIAGTNGKTTCTQLLAQALDQPPRRCAVIGTLGYGFPGALNASIHTTPDAVTVHRLMAEFIGQGAAQVAMEVSSHALEQGRVNGVSFDVAVFTNLTHDHLDYPGTLDHTLNLVQQGMRGAVMVMDPTNGDVLALYSSPSYDPNAFIGGIDPALWTTLSRAEDYPLLDRAIQARYPPGSTWKLVLAAVAMSRGLVGLNSHMPIPCRGGLQYGNRYFHCWRPEGHGDLDLAQAIQYSCDVYFYQLGLKLGVDALLEDGDSLGFGLGRANPLDRRRQCHDARAISRSGIGQLHVIHGPTFGSF